MRLKIDVFDYDDCNTTLGGCAAHSRVLLVIKQMALAGIRHNLQRSLAASTPSGGPQLLRAQFVLAWLHALLQERRSYIPEGWLKFYEFNANDLRVAQLTLEKQARANGKTPPSTGAQRRALFAAINWEAIRGIAENAIYGGRIERELDMGCLRAYVQRYLIDRLVETNGKTIVLAPGVELPTRVSSLRECTEAVVEALPDADDPATFALPANVQRTRERALTRRMLVQLRALHTTSVAAAVAAGGEQSTTGDAQSATTPLAAWSAQLNAVFSFWKRANAQSSLLQQSTTRTDENKKATEATDAADPLATMLEMERAFGVALVSTKQLARSFSAPFCS